MNPSNQGKTGTHIPFIFILFLALFSVSVFPDNVNAKALKNATFAYLDVAQGNAELIKIGNQAVLIDTGKHSEYSTLQSQLKRLGVKTISTLVVTHPDADHMESADDVIADYHVKKIILPQIASTTQCYKRMMSAISKHKVKKDPSADRLHPETGPFVQRHRFFLPERAVRIPTKPVSLCASLTAAAHFSIWAMRPPVSKMRSLLPEKRLLQTFICFLTTAPTPLMAFFS